MNYKNRYPWMTAKLRSQIIEKNKLRLQSHKTPLEIWSLLLNLDKNVINLPLT